MNRINPYSSTKPGNLFVGYEQLRQELLNGFLNGNSYAIIGGRHCGRTSLLYQIEKDLQTNGLESFQAVSRFFSIQTFSSLTPDILFKYLYKLVVSDIDAPACESIEKGEAYAQFLQNLRNARQSLDKEYNGRWMAILLIDDLDRVSKLLPYDWFFKNFRHLLMESEFRRHFRVVAAGSNEMSKLIISGDFPLNKMRIRHLHALRREQSLDLIHAGFEDELDPEEVERPILELTGGHPFLMQQLLKKIYDSDVKMNRETLKRLSGEISKEHNVFQQWSNGFGPAEHVVFQCLLDAPDGAIDVAEIPHLIDTTMSRRDVDEALTVLSYHGVINVSHFRRPRIAGAIFNNWYAQNRRRFIQRPDLNQFFSVTPKPKFGLKVNKNQKLGFVVRNLSENVISNVKMEFQSSAEIEIFQGREDKTYQPHERNEALCSATPHVAKQIAISYKINNHFGEPIYVSAERDNPFIPNQPASLAHFIGRREELQRIREEIHQQHFLLFGPRRIGKTSLLFQIMEELQGSCIPVYISLQQFSKRDGESLFDEFIYKITRVLMERDILNASGLNTTEDRISEIIRCLHEKRLALLIDEMDVGKEVENFDVFIERMRAVIQPVKCIRTVFSSGPFIYRDLVSPRSPLYNMVSQIPLSRFSDDEAKNLLRLAEDRDIVFEEEVIEECLKWTGGLPLYLQIMGDRLYQLLKDRNAAERRATRQIIEKIKQEMINNVFEWQRFWNMFDHMEKTILAICAHEEGPPDIPFVKNKIERFTRERLPFTRVREKLTNLVWHGLLDNSGNGEYGFTARLVHDWLKNKLYYPDEIQDLFFFGGDPHEAIRTAGVAPELLQPYNAGHRPGGFEGEKSGVGQGVNLPWE